MKVTIYEVAEEAGLSIATVSRYINKKGGISPKSEAKIIDAIQKLHYVPAASAQSLALGLSGTVGIQMGQQDLESHYIHQFLSGVSKSVMREGFDLLLTQLEGDTFSACNSVLTRKKMDGIIFPAASSSQEQDYMKTLYEQDFPVCYAGARYEWDKKRSHVYGGYTAYRKDVMELLIRKKCRKILWLEMDQHGVEKTKKIISTSSDKGAFLPVMATDQMSPEEVYQMILEKLKGKDRPDGIFFADPEYTGFIYAAANEAGLKIPVDLKLMSMIHSKQQDKLFTPNLAVVYLDAYQMGYQAGKKICALIQKHDMDPKWDMVPYEIWENETL